ncbi:MAG: hypothetical protein PHW96_00060 [Candidatus Nanoarchaeia archaeon]|nr:hypothetical protein [Candidatus Nanoarchaeia archaeon]
MAYKKDDLVDNRTYKVKELLKEQFPHIDFENIDYVENIKNPVKMPVKIDSLVQDAGSYNREINNIEDVVDEAETTGRVDLNALIGVPKDISVEKGFQELKRAGQILNSALEAKPAAQQAPVMPKPPGLPPGYNPSNNTQPYSPAMPPGYQNAPVMPTPPGIPPIVQQNSIPNISPAPSGMPPIPGQLTPGVVTNTPNQFPLPSIKPLPGPPPSMGPPGSVGPPKPFNPPSKPSPKTSTEELSGVLKPNEDGTNMKPSDILKKLGQKQF